MITARSDKPKSYHYRLLDEIFRDACSDPFTWDEVPKEGSGDLFYLQCRNTVTGDTITCQGQADGSHSFTFEQGLTPSRDVQDAANLALACTDIMTMRLTVSPAIKRKKIK